MQTIIESSKSRAPFTLQALAVKSFDELNVIYREGTTPAAMQALDGDLVGRMLAVRWAERALIADLIRRFAASSSFVWEGKSFEATSSRQGRGINRIRMLGILGRQRLFPFATSFAPSAIDGGPALVLNYDLAENPPYIRKIHDEVREVSPGVYLGPAMWKSVPTPTSLLWFALEGRRTSRTEAERLS